MAYPLFDSYLRVARAEEHFVSLTEIIKRFRDNYAYNVLRLTEIDPQTFRPDTDKVLSRYPDIPFVPDMTNVYMGEAIQNLRTALDYLVFALAKTDNAGVEQEGTQFLIEDDPGHGSGAHRFGFLHNAPRRLKNMKQAHIDLIENLQPYKGCFWTRRIRDLSNPDKHRKLYVPTIAGNFDWSYVSHGPRPDRDGWPCRVFEASGPGGTDMYVYLRTRLQVLCEDDTRLSLPVEPLLKELLTVVPETLKFFEPCVAGACGH